MDIKAYIETGILESYALGICSEEESREVETLCAQYPELKEELNLICVAIDLYASTYIKTPQPFVKQKIFDEIDLLETGQDKKIIKMPVNRYRLTIAVSLALFSLSFISNIIIYNKYKLVNEQVTALNSEKNKLAESMKTNQVKLDMLNKDMSFLTNPMVQKVIMKGVAKSPESLTMVYWNKASKEVFIEIKKLPIPEQGKQYQLWAILDGKPIDAGIITMIPNDSSLQKMKNSDNAQAFAITLEKKGGSPTPNLTEMYVMGTVNL